MTAAQWGPLAAGLAALAAVLTTYVTLRVEQIRGVIARTPAAPVAIVPPVVVGIPTAQAIDAGAGAPSSGRPAPVWNQLADPLPDGTLPAGRYDECGEECAAMEIARQHGTSVAADALRAQLGGPGRGPLTTAADLVKILALNNVAAQVVDCPGDKVAALLQEQAGKGHNAICLGQWVAPGIEHWILVTRADATGAGANDPWAGRRRVWTWGAFQLVCSGQLVLITRPPD
jgi:hypothetical protein